MADGRQDQAQGVDKIRDGITLTTLWLQGYTGNGNLRGSVARF
jgi:hypothetical protein